VSLGGDKPVTASASPNHLYERVVWNQDYRECNEFRSRVLNDVKDFGAGSMEDGTHDKIWGSLVIDMF
jgi:hypothetical protein